MIVILRFLLQLAAWSAMLVLLAGFFGAVHPAFDTMAHFRLHLSAGLIAGALVLLVFSAKKSALAALLTGIAGAYFASTGTVFTATSREAAADRPVYTLFHFNLLGPNERRTEVVELILRLDPDVITVTEQSGEWRTAFSKIDQRWPTRYACRKAGQINATTIYAKWPIIADSGFCGTYGSFARINVTPPDGQPLTLGAAHIRWPWPASGPRQLEVLAPDIAEVAEDAIVAGDFNATTWSFAVREFARIGGLETVPGIGPTWMADIPVVSGAYWAGLPIDNVMEKGRVTVLSARTLSSMGSDHLPVLVEFQLRD